MSIGRLLVQFIQALLEFGGQKFRQTDLFNAQTPMGITRQFIRGMRVRTINDESSLDRDVLI